jgi:hypothetical protein
LNDFDKVAIVAEVKRNPQKIDMSLLNAKANTIKKELGAIKSSCEGCQ